MDKLQNTLSLIAVILVLSLGGTLALNRFLFEAPSNGQRQQTLPEPVPGIVKLRIIVKEDNEANPQAVSFAEVTVIPEQGNTYQDKSDSSGTAIFDLKTQDSVEIWIEKDGYHVENFKVDILSDDTNRVVLLRKKSEEEEPQSKEIPGSFSSETNQGDGPEKYVYNSFNGEMAIDLVRDWLENKSSIFTEPYEVENYFYDFITTNGGLAVCLRDVVIPLLKEGNRDYEYNNHEFLDATSGQLYSGMELRPVEAPREAVVLSSLG